MNKGKIKKYERYNAGLHWNCYSIAKEIKQQISPKFIIIFSFLFSLNFLLSLWQMRTRPLHCPLCSWIWSARGLPVPVQIREPLSFWIRSASRILFYVSQSGRRRKEWTGKKGSYACKAGSGCCRLEKKTGQYQRQTSKSEDRLPDQNSLCKHLNSRLKTDFSTGSCSDTGPRVICKPDAHFCRSRIVCLRAHSWECPMGIEGLWKKAGNWSGIFLKTYIMEDAADKSNK